jgi:hypothetical protein
VAPRCYAFFHGTGERKGLHGLADADPRWLRIEEPDATGFKGMTTHGAMRLQPALEQLYSPDGIKLPGFYSGGTIDYRTMESTVVCFESAPSEDHGRVLHSAVLGFLDNSGGGDTHYVLPPLTLLEVVSVQGPGEWEYMPGKCVNQTLITVRPTYLLPAKKQSIDGVVSKFAADCTFLTYGSTQDAVRGTEDVTADPVLTMRQEWARNDEWKDWTGTTYTGWREWQYVLNPVGGGEQRQEGSGVGERDVGRDGFTLHTFMDTINAHVQEKAKQLKLDDAPLLTRAEVISIRLYEGRARVAQEALAHAQPDIFVDGGPPHERPT